MRVAPIALLLLAGSAWGAPRGLIPPERITAGFADQILGQLSPDGKRVIFVSNENAASQIHVQNRSSGGSEVLFEEPAENSWPRISPDGRHLLYISSEEDALGDLCVRDLVEAEVQKDQTQPQLQAVRRRCLKDPGTADLQAFWFPDGKSAALVSRRTLHGDLLLRQVEVGKSLRESAVLGENVSGPTISPDGKWLAYVPLSRPQGISQVGMSFVAQAKRGVVLKRLGDKTEIALGLGLPGTTGMPAFSPDGTYLYFTQFLNDTNFDGITDGDDHGVLFRVPFANGSSTPVAPKDAARPEQLTSAGWNCQYPTPTKETLLATCATRGALSVYSLPLSGSIGEGMDEKRLLDEISASLDPWERLLLLSHLSRRTEEGEKRANQLLEMVRLHLSLGEFGSARFYTEQYSQIGPAQRVQTAEILKELIDHLKAERAIDRGQLSASFVQEARERLGRLTNGSTNGSTNSPALLALLTRSEIHDTIGEKTEARTLLNQVTDQVDKITEPFVLHALAIRARDLLRSLDERDALLLVYRKLAENEALSEKERLWFADRYVTDLLRGRGESVLADLVEREYKAATKGGEIAFALELEGWLLSLSKKDPEKVREGVFQLYRKNKSGDRRRHLISATIRRAAEIDSEYLTYQFANTWVSGLSTDLAERRFAEQLYRQVVLDRAYVQLGKGKIPDARGNFYGVTLQTDSLESHIGFIEARFAEGKPEVEAEYQKRYGKNPDDPILRFAKAYLIARALLGPNKKAQIAQALAHAAVAEKKLPQRVEIHQLYGFLHHHLYLLGERNSAKDATTHYLLALDLARDRPRHRAALLTQLSALEMAVGNFRLAHSHLGERQRLPFVDSQSTLVHHLSLGRCLLHMGRYREAAKASEYALSLTEKPEDQATLGRFRPLALAQAALHDLVAEEFALARRRYGEFLTVAEGNRNPYVARVGRAASLVGLTDKAAFAEALLDLDEAEKLLAQTDAGAKGLSKEDRLEQNRLILLGLRARAAEKAGDLVQARSALEKRRSLLAARWKTKKVDEDQVDLALCEGMLGKLALLSGDKEAAARHIEGGLRHADQFASRTGTPLHESKTGLLSAYALLHLYHGVPLTQLREDLKGRLETTYKLLCDKKNPEQRALRERFAGYLTLLRLS